MKLRLTNNGEAAVRINERAVASRGALSIEPGDTKRYEQSGANAAEVESDSDIKVHIENNSGNPIRVRAPEEELISTDFKLGAGDAGDYEGSTSALIEEGVNEMADPHKGA